MTFSVYEEWEDDYIDHLECGCCSCCGCSCYDDKEWEGEEEIMDEDLRDPREDYDTFRCTCGSMGLCMCNEVDNEM